MKKQFKSLALGLIFSTLMASLAVHAQDNVIRIQTLQDAWQVRSLQTQAIIKVIRDPNATQAQHDKAAKEFDARLTTADHGELTPIETMELFGLYYVPKELQKKPQNMEQLLEIIAGQATLGWYDALRFADASGRAEISTNEAFFTLPFDQNTQIFIQFMKDHPEQAAAAVKAGIQYARDKIKANNIKYETHWPASFGLLRMQCALKNAQTCEGPKPQPTSEWPALLDQAALKVSTYYRVDESGGTGPGRIRHPNKAAARP